MTEPSPPRKRELWPIAIATVLVLFVIGVVAVAVYSTTQRTDLVVRDYYDAGLAYQEQVESAQRAGEGGAPFVVTRLAMPRGIRLDFADRFRNQPMTGTITLYRPSNADYDRKLELSLDGEAHQLIEMKSLPKGLWKVKVAWVLEGQEYYHEADFVLN